MDKLHENWSLELSRCVKRIAFWEENLDLNSKEVRSSLSEFSELLNKAAFADTNEQKLEFWHQIVDLQAKIEQMFKDSRFITNRKNHLEAHSR